MKRFLILLTGTTLAALLYVHVGVESILVGYDIRKQEVQRQSIEDKIRALNYNIAQLKSPHNLQRRLEAQKIELEAPDNWEKIVLPISIKPQTVAPIASPTLLEQAPALVSRFFLGTAQAESKSSVRKNR